MYEKSWHDICMTKKLARYLYGEKVGMIIDMCRDRGRYRGLGLGVGIESRIKVGGIVVIIYIYVIINTSEVNRIAL